MTFKSAVREQSQLSDAESEIIPSEMVKEDITKFSVRAPRWLHAALVQKASNEELSLNELMVSDLTEFLGLVPLPAKKRAGELTETELEILEELDAYNRAMVRTDLQSFCSLSKAGKNQLVTYADVEQVVISLRNRKYIEGRLKTGIMPTRKALARIKRDKVVHYKDMDGNKTDWRGNPCNEKEKCGECKRVLKEKQEREHL